VGTGTAGAGIRRGAAAEGAVLERAAEQKCAPLCT
jgi:hypothetical protein